MPDYWSTLPQCSFGNINFPVESSRIEGGQRDHVHEYPHTPGGAPELLGRKLYTFHVSSRFDVHFSDEGGYPGLYPGDLGSLLAFFEQGSTQPLRLSQMGSAVPAYAVSWTREQSAKVRSGEIVNITFREDTTEQFLFASMVNVAGSMEFSGQNLGAQIAAVQSQLSNNTMNLFSGLADLVSSIVAWGNNLIGSVTSQFYDAILAAQTICGDLDVQPDMQVPVIWPVIDALHDLWLSLIKLSQQRTQNGAKLQQKINPITQSIGQVSAFIYQGDSSRSSDLLALNNIPDPMAVKAGLSINYFPGS
jgi:hypothetical protein